MAVDLEKIRQIAERVAVSEGLFLVDVEIKGGRSNPLLRIYIDKAGGVSHQDCELVSEQVSVILDVEDTFPTSYTLEVSSPGLDRRLARPAEYEYFAGRMVRLVLCEPAGADKVLEGRLAGLDGGNVRLDMGAEGIREFEISNIKKAQLLVEMNK